MRHTEHISAEIQLIGDTMSDLIGMSERSLSDKCFVTTVLIFQIGLRVIISKVLSIVFRGDVQSLLKKKFSTKSLAVLHGKNRPQSRTFSVFVLCFNCRSNLSFRTCTLQRSITKGAQSFLTFLQVILV